MAKPISRKRGFKHFMRKGLLDVDPVSGCWIWLGRQSKSGYGLVNTKNERGNWGRTTTANHYFFELYRHKIPPGHEAAHECHRRSCVNPRHLRCKTSTDNKLDWFIDQHFTQAQKAQVLDMMQADLPVSVIAERMCAPRPYIHRLLEELEWRDQFNFSLETGT